MNWCSTYVKKLKGGAVCALLMKTPRPIFVRSWLAWVCGCRVFLHRQQSFGETLYPTLPKVKQALVLLMEVKRNASIGQRAACDLPFTSHFLSLQDGFMTWLREPNAEPIPGYRLIE